MLYVYLKKESIEWTAGQNNHTPTETDSFPGQLEIDTLANPLMNKFQNSIVFSNILKYT